MDMTAIERIISDNILGFPVESIAFLGEGDFCVAYCVNNEWVFRLAKDEDASKRLEREALLLPRLAPQLNLRIPNIELQGCSPLTGLAFVGYRRVPGNELTKERFSRLSIDERGRIAHELAEFTWGLHSFDLDTARQLGISDYDYPSLFSSDLERAERRAFTIMDSEMQDYCRQIIQQHLRCGKLEFQPALLHDDLSQWHILFDSEIGAVTGIIDFTDVAIGDPAQDLMYIYDDYGPEFTNQLLDCHSEAVRSCILDRVHFYHEWHTLRRLLWAVENKHELLISRRLDELRDLKNRAVST
ncbi:MAG: phosphotransferase [Armatimonadota bacterium]|nr:phosphotransferase [Armatimonadota bacterium]